MPILEYDGKIIPQSGALLRFVGKIGGALLQMSGLPRVVSGSCSPPALDATTSICLVQITVSNASASQTSVISSDELAKAYDNFIGSEQRRRRDHPESTGKWHVVGLYCIVYP